MNSKKKYYVWRSKSRVFCFKQIPLIIKQKSDFLYHLIDGVKLLSLGVEVVDVSVEKPLDIHDASLSIT